MSNQILFFNKNKLDISNVDAVLTATQGNDYIDLVRNRSNASGWVTTGSVDTDNTTIVIDFGDVRSVSDIILIRHNLKKYTIQYWDEISAYIDFSTAINETANTADTKIYTFTEVETSKIRIVITGTFVADEDKYIAQIIATTRIGQFTGYPVISGLEIDKNKILNNMLSGKKSVVENVGGVSFQLAIPFWNIVADLNIIEDLYDSNEGFLTWLCGGSESQFLTPIKGYRLEDIYLMKCGNEYSPDFVKGIYINGLDLKIKLVEVVD